MNNQPERQFWDRRLHLGKPQQGELAACDIEGYLFQAGPVGASNRSGAECKRWQTAGSALGPRTSFSMMALPTRLPLL